MYINPPMVYSIDSSRTCTLTPGEPRRIVKMPDIRSELRLLSRGNKYSSWITAEQRAEKLEAGPEVEQQEKHSGSENHWCFDVLFPVAVLNRPHRNRCRLGMARD